MDYLKSLIAGTVVLAIAVALSPIVMGIYFFLVYRPGAKGRLLGSDFSCETATDLGDKRADICGRLCLGISTSALAERRRQIAKAS